MRIAQHLLHERGELGLVRRGREHSRVDRHLGVAVGERVGRQSEATDVEVDARERRARRLHELEVGRLLLGGADRPVERAHFVGREHVGRGERIFVRYRVGQLAHRASGEPAPPPPPTTALTASAPTNKSAATPAAATSDPSGRRRRTAGLRRHERDGVEIGIGPGRRVARDDVGRRRVDRAREHVDRSPAASPGARDRSARRAGHSPFASMVNSSRNRRRARISATRALPFDIPTASAASATDCPLDLDEVQQRPHPGREAHEVLEIARVRRRPWPAAGRSAAAPPSPGSIVAARRWRGSRSSAAGTARGRGCRPGAVSAPWRRRSGRDRRDPRRVARSPPRTAAAARTGHAAGGSRRDPNALALPPGPRSRLRRCASPRPSHRTDGRPGRNVTTLGKKRWLRGRGSNSQPTD